MSSVVSLQAILSRKDGVCGRDRAFLQAWDGLTRLKVGESKENNVLMTAPVTFKEGLEWKQRGKGHCSTAWIFHHSRAGEGSGGEVGERLLKQVLVKPLGQTGFLLEAKEQCWVELTPAFPMRLPGDGQDPSGCSWKAELLRASGLRSRELWLEKSSLWPC